MNFYISLAFLAVSCLILGALSYIVTRFIFRRLGVPLEFWSSSAFPAGFAFALTIGSNSALFIGAAFTLGLTCGLLTGYILHNKMK